MKYSSNPEELFLQLIPLHSQARLVATKWDGIQCCYLSIMRPDDAVYTSRIPQFYLDQARIQLRIRWTSGRQTSLANVMEKRVLASVNTLLAPHMFTLEPMPHEDLRRACDLSNIYFKLKCNSADSPPGLHIPDVLHGNWTSLLPRDSKEGQAYVAAWQLRHEQERAQNANPQAAHRKFEEATAAL